MADIIPIILSGGAGTRLWPLSTERLPKQFMRIWNGGRSLLAEAPAAARPPRGATPR